MKQANGEIFSPHLWLIIPYTPNPKPHIFLSYPSSHWISSHGLWVDLDDVDETEEGVEVYKEEDNVRIPSSSNSLKGSVSDAEDSYLKLGQFFT